MSNADNTSQSAAVPFHAVNGYVYGCNIAEGDLSETLRLQREMRDVYSRFRCSHVVPSPASYRPPEAARVRVAPQVNP